MLAQCLTAGVLFGAGDVIAQQGIEKRGWKQHDVSRQPTVTRLFTKDTILASFYASACSDSTHHVLRDCALRTHHDKMVSRPWPITICKPNARRSLEGPSLFLKLHQLIWTPRIRFGWTKQCSLLVSTLPLLSLTLLGSQDSRFDSCGRLLLLVYDFSRGQGRQGGSWACRSSEFLIASKNCPRILLISHSRHTSRPSSVTGVSLCLHK